MVSKLGRSSLFVDDVCETPRPWQSYNEDSVASVQFSSSSAAQEHPLKPRKAESSLREDDSQLSGSKMSITGSLQGDGSLRGDGSLLGDGSRRGDGSLRGDRSLREEAFATGMSVADVSVGDESVYEGGEGGTAYVYSEKASSVVSPRAGAVMIPVTLPKATDDNGPIHLFTFPFSDPVSALYVGPSGLVLGTLLGRVLLMKFSETLATQSRVPRSNAHEVKQPQQLIHGTLTLLQAFSEDAIRYTYCDERKVSCIVGNMTAYEWPMDTYSWSATAPDIVRFDRRISPQMKFVLSDEARVLIPSLGITMLYDADATEQWLCPLRLPDLDVVPLAFKADHLIAFVHGTEDQPPSIRVLRLPLSREEPQWNTTAECIFHRELPGNTGVSHAGFWGLERLVFVTKGRHIYVFDIATSLELIHIKGHKNEICMICSNDPSRLITVDETGLLKMWNCTGTCIYTKSLNPSEFYLGNKYCCCLHGNLFVYSADRCYLMLMNLGQDDRETVYVSF